MIKKLFMNILNYGADPWPQAGKPTSLTGYKLDGIGIYKKG